MKTNEIELKPCPFCGSKDIKKTFQCDDHDGNGFYTVYCADCLAEVGEGTEERSITLWNNRNLDALLKELTIQIGNLQKDKKRMDYLSNHYNVNEEGTISIWGYYQKDDNLRKVIDNVMQGME